MSPGSREAEKLREEKAKEGIWRIGDEAGGGHAQVAFVNLGVNFHVYETIAMKIMNMISDGAGEGHALLSIL